MQKAIKRSSNFTEEEVISLSECRKYCKRLAISDQRMIEISNSLVGIVDSIINSYLEGLQDGREV